MTTTCEKIRRTMVGLFLTVVVGMFAVSTSRAADTNVSVKLLGGTNAVVVNTNAYKAIFDVKARDPFYPHSTRANAESADGAEGSPTVILVLKGISGTAKRRSAIINDHTFMVGDESEVATSNGRVRIRCYEIRVDVVIVSVGANPERMELRLPIRY